MTGFEIAKTMIGLQEIRDRSELMKFFKAHAKKNDIVVDPATTPWCAAFINATERAAGNPGTGKLNARSFLTYGNRTIERAKPGDIVIFSRGSNSWQGHVAYFVEWDNAHDTLIVLGGNQNDMVCYAHYSQDRVLTTRRYK